METGRRVEEEGTVIVAIDGNGRVESGQEVADVDCEEEMMDKVSCGTNARSAVRAVW